MATNYKEASEAFMRIIDDYAEARHTQGHPSYNAGTLESRNKVEGIVQKLLLSYDTLTLLVPDAPKELPELQLT